MEKKRCSRCGTKKSLGCFGTFSHPITGKKSYQAWCRECFRVYVKARRSRMAASGEATLGGRQVVPSGGTTSVSELLERHGGER